MVLTWFCSCSLRDWTCLVMWSIRSAYKRSENCLHTHLYTQLKHSPSFCCKQNRSLHKFIGTNINSKTSAKYCKFYKKSLLSPQSPSTSNHSLCHCFPGCQHLYRSLCHCFPGYQHLYHSLYHCFPGCQHFYHSLYHCFPGASTSIIVSGYQHLYHSLRHCFSRSKHLYHTEVYATASQDLSTSIIVYTTASQGTSTFITVYAIASQCTNTSVIVYATASQGPSTFIIVYTTASQGPSTSIILHSLCHCFLRYNLICSSAASSNYCEKC